MSSVRLSTGAARSSAQPDRSPPLTPLTWTPLAAARQVGLRTARPREFGQPTGYDLPHDRSSDFIAHDFKHLASQLGT
jgi:hypothetical protein